MNTRHLVNNCPSTDIDIDFVGLKDFIIHHDSVRRLKAGVTLKDSTILQSSQPLLYAVVRTSGHCILTRFDAIRINAHITVDGETVFTASASNMESVR